MCEWTVKNIFPIFSFDQNKIVDIDSKNMLFKSGIVIWKTIFQNVRFLHIFRDIRFLTTNIINQIFLKMFIKDLMLKRIG